MVSVVLGEEPDDGPKPACMLKQREALNLVERYRHPGLTADAIAFNVRIFHQRSEKWCYMYFVNYLLYRTLYLPR